MNTGIDLFNLFGLAKIYKLRITTTTNSFISLIIINAKIKWLFIPLIHWRQG